MLRLLAVLLLSLAAIHAQTLTEIGVTGNKRLPAAAVAKATGLHTGQHVTKAELETATQTLFNTGFFTGVNFRYKTQPTAKGMTWAVTYEVVEDRVDSVGRLDIPGLDEDKLWQDLKQADGLLDQHMPSNDQVVNYYRRAIEEYLTKTGHPHKLETANQTDPVTRQMATAFIPTDLPDVTDISFEGNQVLGAKFLQAATSMLLVGGKHSERELRTIVDYNARPLYEERGYLTVAFPSVKLVGSSVVVQVVEGPAWSLGHVSLNGDALPTEPMLKAAAFAEGKPANWKALLDGITKMERVLRRDGFLAVSSKPVRQFHEADHVVDVGIDVHKGSQSFLGSVEFHGLTADDEDKAHHLWKLKAEAPLDQFYADDFWRELYKAIEGSMKSMTAQMRPHPDSNIVDLVLVFK